MPTNKPRPLPRTVPTTATPGTISRCRVCGKVPLKWWHTDGKWRLFEMDNTIHQCVDPPLDELVIDDAELRNITQLSSLILGATDHRWVQDVLFCRIQDREVAWRPIRNNGDAFELSVMMHVLGLEVDYDHNQYLDIIESDDPVASARLAITQWAARVVLQHQSKGKS